MPMAFAAIRGSVDWQLTIALIAANLCWVIAYDTYYAMADRDDDLKIGVKSSAITFGHYDRSEEHTSELQSLMRISYAVFCLKQKKRIKEQVFGMSLVKHFNSI